MMNHIARSTSDWGIKMAAPSVLACHSFQSSCVLRTQEPFSRTSGLLWQLPFGHRHPAETVSGGTLMCQHKPAFSAEFPNIPRFNEALVQNHIIGFQEDSSTVHSAFLPLLLQRAHLHLLSMPMPKKARLQYFV